MIKTCENCKKEFTTYPSINSKCCSKKCFYELRKKYNFEKYKCKCLKCGSIFLPKRQAEGGMFCSYKCRGMAERYLDIERNGY